MKYNVWNNSSLDCEETLLISGKLLFLCQKFEYLCKTVLSTELISNFIGEYKSNYDKLKLKDVKEIHEKLEKMMMGRLLAIFKNKPLGFKESSIEVLNDAVESRNDICHELLIELIHEGSKNFVFELFKKEETKNKPDLKNQDILLMWIKKAAYEKEKPASSKFELNENKILSYIKNIAEAIFFLELCDYYQESGEKESFYDYDNKKIAYVSEIESWIFKKIKRL